MRDVSNELAQLYRDVFSTPKGKVVLFHILEELGFHEIIITEQEKILKNYSMRLLEIIGGGRMEQNSVTDFVTKLMKQPLEKERKE